MIDEIKTVEQLNAETPEKVEAPIILDPAPNNVSGNDGFTPTGVVRPDGYKPIYKKVFINGSNEGKDEDDKKEVNTANK